MSRAEPDRDRYGRYLLPDPKTGKRRAYTRTTTVAKVLSDTTALDRWGKRMVASGMAARPELCDLARFEDDREALDGIAEAALQAAGAGAAAEAGTNLHTLTELVDLGELRLADVPAEQVDDVRAYVFGMAKAEVEILPEYIEGLIVCSAMDVAGTFDRILRLKDGRLVIGDLKTGKNLSYSWGDIAVQLAVYANADGIYDADSGEYLPMPEVDKEYALVMHLPVGQARMELYDVNIRAGWEAALLAKQVREHRGKKDWATSIYEYDAETALLEAVTRTDSVEALTELWSANAGRWTQAHTRAAATHKAALLAA
jgi:hypothetical protein